MRDDSDYSRILEQVRRRLIEGGEMPPLSELEKDLGLARGTLEASFGTLDDLIALAIAPDGDAPAAGRSRRGQPKRAGRPGKGARVPPFVKAIRKVLVRLTPEEDRRRRSWRPQRIKPPRAPRK